MLLLPDESTASLRACEIKETDRRGRDVQNLGARLYTNKYKQLIYPLCASFDASPPFLLRNPDLGDLRKEDCGGYNLAT